jgi:hypothetical protein
MAMEPAIPALIIVIGLKKPEKYAPITTPSMVSAPSNAFITKYLLDIRPTLEISEYFFHLFNKLFIFLSGIFRFTSNKQDRITQE